MTGRTKLWADQSRFPYFIAVCTGELWNSVCICMLAVTESGIVVTIDTNPDLAIFWGLFFFMADICMRVHTHLSRVPWAMELELSEAFGSDPLKISRSIHPFWAIAWQHSQELAITNTNTQFKIGLGNGYERPGFMQGWIFCLNTTSPWRVCTRCSWSRTGFLWA